MRTASLIAFLAALATIAVIVPVRSLRAQGERKPFTLTEVTRYYAPDGKDTTTETTIFGVRSDGSWFRDFTRQFDSADGKPRTVNFRKFADFSRGLRVSLFPALQAVTTTPAERQAPPEPACAEGQPDGTILGQPVRLVTKVAHMDDRTVERKMWVAPDLGCHILRLQTAVTMSDGRSGGTNSMEVASISPGDPSPAYFLAPRGWTEKPPSEVTAEAAALTNAPPCPNCDATGAMLDNAYRASRARPGWK